MAFFNPFLAFHESFRRATSNLGELRLFVPCETAHIFSNPFYNKPLSNMDLTDPIRQISSLVTLETIYNV